MSARQYRKVAAIALVTTVGLSLAACSSSTKSNSGTNASGKTTIVVDCAPLKTQGNNLALPQFKADIATFEKSHPDVTIIPESVGSQCDNPPDFTARLQAGTEADVYYGYFTDLGQILDAGQAEDITKYIDTTTLPNWSSVDGNWKNVFQSSGEQYGIPTSNYSMGLVYNKKLFQQAGISTPPTTWQDVATDAKAIAALGNGIYGYADYSAGNTGGWHFTAEMYSRGGDDVTADGKTADFDNPTGQAVLQQLYDMRWKDNSVGTKQLLQWPDLLTLAGAGKVGMYLGAPDSITAIVTQFKGSYGDWAMSAMPGDNGPAKGALAGGNGYFFKKGDTPAQIKAGLEWLSFEYLTPGQGQFNYPNLQAQQAPVGLPEPQLFTSGSAADQQQQQLEKQYENVDPADYQAFVKAAIPPVPEPPNAQAIYAILDGVMSSVLTQQNANIPQLLKNASDKVNTLLKSSS